MNDTAAHIPPDRPRPKRTVLKRLEHAFKAFFFFVVQLAFKRGRNPKGNIDPATVKRVLFLRHDRLGDMVISLPVFHNLKKMYPHIEIAVLCSPRNLILIREDAGVDRKFVYTKNIFRDLMTLRQIRRLKYDVVIDMILRDSVTALILSQMVSSRAWRVGLNKFDHARYYDYNYKNWDEKQPHMLDYTLGLIGFLGLDVAKLETQVPPVMPQKSIETIGSFLGSLNGTGTGFLIGLNISAGRPSRVWPKEKNISLMTRLLERYPSCHIIITSDPSEQHLAAALAAEFEGRVTAIMPGLNLLDVSALISRMKMLISPDTSLVHIARAFNVPVVGLYTRARENYQHWHPYGQKGGTVISGDDYNLFDISVDDVFKAATTLVPPETVS
jgi:ADP-heptose:LPS heptosyltransferase